MMTVMINVAMWTPQEENLVRTRKGNKKQTNVRMKQKGAWVAVSCAVAVVKRKPVGVRLSSSLLLHAFETKNTVYNLCAENEMNVLTVWWFWKRKTKYTLRREVIDLIFKVFNYYIRRQRMG